MAGKTEKLTVKQVLEIEMSLNSLNVAPKATVSFKIAKFKKDIKDTLESYNETRTKLIKEEYGVPRGENGDITVDPDRMEEFMEEIDKLQAEEVEITVQKFALSDFTDKDGKELNVNPNFFTGLADFITQ